MDLEVPEAAKHGPPASRARETGHLIEQVSSLSNELSRLRREAIEEMLGGGMTKAEVARELGLDPSRISRIVRSGTPPERALLSPDGGPVIVALGSKSAQVGDGHPNDMISRDAAEAYDVLRSCLNHYGVGCEREVVPAPGMIDLNRDRLIVLGSPKVLPTVGQIMASDPHLGFDVDDTGRHLVELGDDPVIHRSPQDRGEPGDVAYIGRLPRPDGRGHFLYLAGIHAAGTYGAARYLADHAAELYSTARDRLFSLLVSVTYRSASDHTIVETRALTTTHVR